ncbi:xylose isomerase [Spirochaeta thermophila]|uniref:Xylose isomerase n=1 Tax=Winmispira thermophila (strain ATCC 49972 / DSM 6192 / RI 19.B1) TaxID=665571 RepID=E0RNH8_WINT6|nr:xylose isomerase [Spirochaeta thermophila]ADN02569.1 xylose isomerase [Spirochaeta thermophila DSM 6192]
MINEFFKNISKIPYEGPGSDNPLAFKYYNPDEVIGGKPLKEHLRFALAYWHTLNGSGQDPFGVGTMIRPWLSISDPMEQAKARMRACFEIAEKLEIPFFCFHDRDIAPEGTTLRETNKLLDEVVEYTKDLMKDSPVKLLWGTANLFSHPRYVHGASTSPNAEVFAYAAAQVKKALEVTLYLGGQNYVFWGGREGYETLLNTNMQLELDNLARFLHMAVDYAKKIGFKGQFLIEPKPKEPTKHQYDFDVAAVYGFLKKYDLLPYFKVNIEMNHATLAYHTFQHELHFARINGILGSMDVNQGDYLLGWDTDQFPTNLYETTLAMYEVIKNGGIAPGGLNFDAKVRRGSFEPEDIFIAHIAGMDAFARGFKVAWKLLEDKAIEKHVEERYASYREGIGKKIVEGKVGFEDLEAYIIDKAEIKNASGRQELLEAVLNRYLLEA